MLFVDDEPAIRDVMKIELPRMGHDVVMCEDGHVALKALDKQPFDAAIVDLRMPGLSGWDVIQHIKKVSPETEVIISTGHCDVDATIQAIRMGAYDFLRKPCKLVEISAALKRVAEKRTLTNKTIALENRLKAVEGSPDLIGHSPPMLRVKKLCEKIAPTDSSVLIQGETGTVKVLVARRIHDLSPRKNMPFVPVNCGALAEHLVESELFGHGKGAYTGADKSRKGLIEVANGGTLFLDEFGELDKSMQVKLLRFLESGDVRRVGENEAFHVDVRVVCATNRNIQKMVSDGEFREDLYFRINTFEIPLPPLRERKDDIPELARTLIARYMKRRDIPDSLLSAESISVLKQHEWPGNVRELANALERALIMSDGITIRPEDLPTHLLRNVSVSDVGSESVAMPAAPKTLREIEMDMIHKALDKFQGDKPKAAAELGIALKTLYNKLNADQTKVAG